MKIIKDEPKNLLRHILELRETLVKSAFAILIGMVISFLFIDEILEFISTPLVKILKESGKNYKMIYTSITEIFSTHLKISFYSALSITFPYVLFQFWKFIKPGLRGKEIYLSKKLFVCSLLLFLFGGLFAFYIVIPNIFYIFINNPLMSAEFLPKLSENISFITILVLSFGISFQLPILIYSLDKFKILRVTTIAQLWREVILAIVILSAIITPPDAMSMVFLALPLILLYFLSILFCLLKGNEKH